MDKTATDERGTAPHPQQWRRNSVTAQSLFEYLADVETGAYAVSADQTILFWNRGAERIMGMGPDEAVGRSATK